MIVDDVGLLHLHISLEIFVVFVCQLNTEQYRTAVLRAVKVE